MIDADVLIEHRFKNDISYNAFVSLVKRQPTIDPVKHGRWIEFESDEDKYNIIKCSCCKHTFTVDSYHWTDIGFVKDDFNYCPNCGARMRGEEDDCN